MLEFKVTADMKNESGQEQFMVYNIKKLSHYLAYSHLLEMVKNLKCKLIRHRIEEVNRPSSSPQQLALPAPAGLQKPHIVRPAVVVPPTPAAVPWYEDPLTVSKSHIQHTTVINEWRSNA